MASELRTGSDPSIGLMQGRLSPPPPHRLQAFPHQTWREEFHRAREVGFDEIEWIFEWDDYGENPLWTVGGRKAIRDTIHEAGVAVKSVCADYFMKDKLAPCSATALAVLVELIQRCADLGVERILLPLLEESHIRTADLQDQVMEAISGCLPVAEECGVELALETDLPGSIYAGVVKRFGHPLVRAYYDTGNATAAGWDIAEEVEPLLGLLGSVHVKDRLVDGHSVRLGTGGANFDAFFRRLAAAWYSGPYVLQPAFGPDYVGDARYHLDYIRGQLSRAQLGDRES